MARLCHLHHKKQYNVRNITKKAHLSLFVNKAVGLKFILLASKPLIIMQIPQDFNKHVLVIVCKINIKHR